jgi:DnaJ-class molecular chaperone
MNYWKCSVCHGTGRVFSPWYSRTSERCGKCDGTGNAFVDGRAEAHRRRLDEEREDQFGATPDQERPLTTPER